MKAADPLLGPDFMALDALARELGIAQCQREEIQKAIPLDIHPNNAVKQKVWMKKHQRHLLD